MMSLRRSLAALCVAGPLTAALLAQTPAKPKLDVRMGLWDITTTVDAGGQMPGVDTSRMTPQQQAEMAAAMRGMSAPQTTSTRSCITREDFDRKAFVNLDRNCRQTLTTNTKTRLEATVRCTGTQAMTGSVSIEARTPTAYTGAMKTSATERGRRTTTTVTMAGTWIAAECGDIK